MSEPQPRTSTGQFCGIFYAWNAGMATPELPLKPSLELVVGRELLSQQLGDLGPADVAERALSGHEPFALMLNGALASYGWSSTGHVEVSELGFSFEVPPDERYLWDFATLPRFRGKGLYPRLLQAIVQHLKARAEWFWIGHHPENEASRRGILKAGFLPVGELWRRPDGLLVLRPEHDAEAQTVRRAARTLGVPLTLPDTMQ